MSKKHCLPMAFLFLPAFSLPALAQDNGVKMKIDDIPAAVKKTVIAQSQGAAVAEVEQETEDGKISYEAEVQIGKDNYEIKVADDGKLISKKIKKDDDDTTPPTQDSKPGYAVTNTFKIGGEGGWDYAIVDPSTHYLYTSRGNHTQVIDTTAGTVIADLPKCGAHGIALVSAMDKGFTSDGRADTVTVFDLKKNTVLYTVPTGHNPDCIIYDPSSKKVFAFDGRSNDATVIDPAALTPNLSVVAHIPLDGKPEFAVSDRAGQVYVNIEDKNEIQQIDTKSMTIAATWKIDGESPSGLAMDIKHRRLFAGCDGKMVIVDANTGKTIATPKIGDGVDACGFDPTTEEAFASCGDGTLAVIKETSPAKFETVQTVITKPGARTMALDPSTQTIYLDSAEMLEKQPGERRAKMKPDSFAVLVVTAHR